MKRRRFLQGLSAGALIPSCRNHPDVEVWQGIAMGIQVTVKYRGQADLEPALKVVGEAEKVLTLWSADSALSRLNRDGFLADPPKPLLDCMGKSRELFEKSDGLFDPTTHSFLSWVKSVYESGRTPDSGEIEKRLEKVDFGRVEFSESKVVLPEGVSIGFNAIAQGYLTDLFVENFDASSALVNFGEYRVIGDESWPVEVKGRTHELKRALAVSSGSGQRLSATTAANHLIHPRTGGSPPPRKVAAVEAEEAWLADGLSTVVAIGGGIPDRYQSAMIL